MDRLHFLVIGLLGMLFLVACNTTTPAATMAQPAGASPEITVYKSPT